MDQGEKVIGRWGSPEKKLGAGGLEGWPVRRRTGGGEWFRGEQAGVAARAGRGRRVLAVWPVVAGGSGGWSLMINCRPLISYPTAGNLMTRDEKVSRLTCSLTPHVHMHAHKTRTHAGMQH